MNLSLKVHHIVYRDTSAFVTTLTLNKIIVMYHNKNRMIEATHDRNAMRKIYQRKCGSNL